MGSSGSRAFSRRARSAATAADSGEQPLPLWEGVAAQPKPARTRVGALSPKRTGCMVRADGYGDEPHMPLRSTQVDAKTGRRSPDLLPLRRHPALRQDAEVPSRLSPLGRRAEG